ncbi:MAG: monofunctional biosynthetic peptidoglycan transglycosylase [Methylococcaceae bacterium]|nr:monofunctional biosynthetic peptidoglycan transglycosylase [Methylococcaceae bacterium]
MAKNSRPLLRKPIAIIPIRAILKKILLYFVASSLVLVLLFSILPLPTTMFMLYRHYEDLFQHHTVKAIDYDWVGSSDISSNAQMAVIASEDQQFFEHFGFDFASIRSAASAYINGGRRLRGASTISQQVAKNIFLTPSKSFIRKGLEVWFTVLIELVWTKERILVVYLNIAEFGDHLFGIEAASQRYFGISAKHLSRAQAALLAATLPNPIRLKAARPSGYVWRRQQWILRQMRNLGNVQDLAS